jgi:hypothetical protein
MVPVNEMPDEELEFDAPHPAVSLAEIKNTAGVSTLTVTNVASKTTVQVMVCSLNDLKTGAAYPATAREKQLALFLHDDGRIFAADAMCPHAGGPLDESAMRSCEVHAHCTTTSSI